MSNSNSNSNSDEISWKTVLVVVSIFLVVGVVATIGFALMKALDTL